MTAEYRTRNQTNLAVIESPRGTEGAPTVGSNAIRTRGTQIRANSEMLATDFDQASLTRSKRVPAGLYSTAEVPLFLLGAGTAGQAPEIGPLLRACSMSQTLTAADVTGTAQAGSANTLTLAAGASAVTDAYKGMVLELTGGTGAGQAPVVITGYNGTTKVATVFPDFTSTPDGTSAYAVRANALYKPVTASPEAITWWRYMHRSNPAENSRRRRIVGCAGNLRMGIRAGQYGTLDVSLRGLQPAEPDDVSHPGTPTYATVQPQRYASARSFFGSVGAAAAIKFEEFNFDLGNQLEQFMDPATAEGYDIADVLTRAASGSITPNKVLKSARDAFADWRANTSRILWLNWGSAAGKRVSLLLPQITPAGVEDADVRGYGAETIAFDADLQDGEIYICCW